MYTEAKAELEVASLSADRSDPESVATHIAALGRAARRYLPFGPSATARRELAEIGRRGAPGAYAELRASILAVRWLVTPDRALLAEAEHAIAGQRARQLLAAGAVAAPDPDRLAELARSEEALLAAHTEPSRPLALVALIGCGLFLAGLWRGLTTTPGARPGLVAALGFLLFVVGLWRA